MHHIIVFGEMLADIFPNASVLGGAPFNVAYHLHAFKQHPILISRIGKDDLASQCKARMSSIGMCRDGIQTDATYPTGQVTVTIVNSTHQFEINNHQAYDFIDAETAATVVSVNTPRLIYFGTLAQRNPTTQQALDAVLKTSDCLRFVDINLRQPWYDKSTITYTLTHADIIKLSGEELAEIASLFAMPNDNFAEAANSMIKQFSLKTLYLTLGNEGAWVFSKTGAQHYAAAHVVHDQVLADTVGAGDAFSSVAILGTLDGWALPTILSRANAFAAKICQIRGATPDNINFYQSVLT